MICTNISSQHNNVPSIFLSIIALSIPYRPASTFSSARNKSQTEIQTKRCNQISFNHRPINLLQTRIYVFVGQREMLVRFMKQMKVEQMFAEGKYMVVYLFPDTVVYDELGFFLWNKEGEYNVWYKNLNCCVHVFYV